MYTTNNSTPINKLLRVALATVCAQVIKRGSRHYNIRGDVGVFDYYKMQKYVILQEKRGVKVGSIGRSEWGKELYYLHVGNSEGKQIIITGGIHAREIISAYLCCCLSVKYSEHSGVGIYFIPMLNPDGNLLVCGKAKKEEGYGKAVKINGNSEDFSLWKANGNGVDLNVNFPAKYGYGKQNVFAPAPSSYVGENALCAKESKALYDFTKRVQPAVTLSYHSKGREIYWDFNQFENRSRDKAIAKAIERVSGYKLIDGDLDSAGGYKDWCIETLKIPAYTIEIGDDKYLHPLKSWCIIEEWNANKLIPSVLAENI